MLQRSRFLLIFAFLTACGPGPEPAAIAADASAAALASSSHAEADQAAHGAHQGDAIEWYDGTVDAAFAAAKEEGKPLFLYWGAVWCPPCQQIKATIFARREFIERSRLFVPVYLDGDTERAQAQGERFGVLGYPTMIVFAPDGTELTRLPGGINVELYANVLDLALQEARPVSAIVRAVQSGESVSAADWTLLAYYSFGQDNERALAGMEEGPLLRTLAEKVPPELEAESSRLFVEYLRSMISASNAEGGKPLSADQRSAALTRVTAILTKPELVAANMYLLLYDSADVTGALTDSGSEQRAQLKAQWLDALDKVAADDAVSITERVNTVGARIQLARLDQPEGPLPPALVNAVRERAAWADSVTSNAWERQAVINSAWYVLSEAGLESEASAMLEAELARSKSPYYFMIDLADLAHKAGRTEEAIAWLRRAWDEAQGPATRFQWGAFYVMGLLEMVPEDGARIQKETLAVLAELTGRDDAFAGRNKRYLVRLEKNLRSWNEDGAHVAEIASLRGAVQALCTNVPAEDDARATCESFLAKS